MIGEVRRATEGGNVRPWRAWAMLAAGVTAGLIGMQVSVVRPTRAELDGVRRELAAVRTDLDGLVGRRDQLWQANTLLGELKVQARELKEAGAAIETIKRFRADVQAEGTRSLGALASLDVLSSLQQTLIDAQPEAEAARVELERTVALHRELAATADDAVAARDAADKLATLQQTLLYQADRNAVAAQTLDRMIGTQARLIEERQTAAVAAESLAEIADVQAAVIAESASAGPAAESLSGIADVLARLMSGGDRIDAADAGLNRFVALAESVRRESVQADEADTLVRELGALKTTVLNEADAVYVARDAAERLASLRDELAARAEPQRTAVAYETADSLVTLRDRLSGAADVAAARTNLDALLGIETDLAAQTRAVVDAVQSLELLADLRDEITGHIKMMEGVRRDLVEIALMESAVNRAVRIIEPLAKLGDLRRLGDDELRAAARSILNGRTERLAGPAAPIEPAPIRTAAEPIEAPTIR